MVTAGRQTAGRGRERRVWESPPGMGVYTSFCFILDTPQHLHLLSLVSGIAVIETLSETGEGIRLGLKWPNDVLVLLPDGKTAKIAGILIENMIFDQQVVCIAGMGINLNQEPGDFPPELRDRAVSLKMLMDSEFQSDRVNPVLVKRFFHWVEILKQGNTKLIIDTVNDYSEFLQDREIRFHHNNEIVRGIFKGIAPEGGLILESPGGEESIYFSGEIDNRK